MRPLIVSALLLPVFAGPLRAGQVEAPVSIEFSPGTGSGAIGSSLGSPVPFQLAAPSLGAAALSAPTPAGLSAAAPMAVAARPVNAVIMAQAVVPLLPTSVLNSPPPSASLRPAAAATDGAAAERGRAEGGALFDQTNAKPAASGAPSFWSRLRERVPFGENAPEWPGTAGQKLRVGGLPLTLGSIARQNPTATVWRAREDAVEVEIRLVPPARGEAGASRELDASGLLASRLRAESADGRVLIKEIIDGATAGAILEKGAFTRPQRDGWAELAAKLITRGITADLSRDGLIWDRWGSRWAVVDGAGVKSGGPAATLDSLMAPGLLARAGIEPNVFLAGVRARLGPDSGLWGKTKAALKAPALAELARRDAAAPAAPALVFGPAPKGPPGLDDAIVSAREAAARLGYDPLRAKAKSKLHGDDPGKLNTIVTAVSAPGKRPVVVKTAQWSIIQSELAVRRLARRFFGRYLRVPASLAVDRGRDSYMVMETIDGSPSYYQDVFDREQRVAAALFAHTFGLGDVNPGNAMIPRDGGLPWLIDFEVAFGRAKPNSKRLPDERIAQEMPWMSRRAFNRVEDYQPAVRAWRAALAKPENRAGILADLAAAGFAPTDAASLLTRFDLNAADLDWTLQNDADFVNQFVDRKAAQR